MKSFWPALLLSLGYLTTALLCVRQWNGAAPWGRLDLPAAAFFLTALAVTAHVANLFRILPAQSLREFAGLHFDPLTEKLGSSLVLLEITVFLDYGQWRLAPFLESSLLRHSGAVLGVLSALGWLWVDRHLVQSFLAPQRRLLRAGPFQYLRHPRYSGILVYKAAQALIFASLLGWLFVLCWTAVLHRRIRLEERFLEDSFGDEYRGYARTTWRILPGIY